MTDSSTLIQKYRQSIRCQTRHSRAQNLIMIKGKVDKFRSDESHFVIETELGYAKYSRAYYISEEEYYALV